MIDEDKLDDFAKQIFKIMDGHPEIMDMMATSFLIGQQHVKSGAKPITPEDISMARPLYIADRLEKHLLKMTELTEQITELYVNLKEMAKEGKVLAQHAEETLAELRKTIYMKEKKSDGQCKTAEKDR